jgi:PAS domain S-box-containing protein
VRAFDPERPVEPLEGGPTTEVRDLARSFADLAGRLTEQRRSLVASERRFRELFAASPTPLLQLDAERVLRDANPAAEPYLGGPANRAPALALDGFLDRPSTDDLVASFDRTSVVGETVVEAVWKLADGERAEVELRIGWAGDEVEPGYLVAVHDLTDRVRRMGERWRRTFDAMVDGVALVDGEGAVVLANDAIEPHAKAVVDGLAGRLRGEAPRLWRTDSGGRLLDCSLTEPAEFEHAILVVRDVTEAADAEARLRDAEKMQAVGTLASGVAHDFNNLLAAILLHVRLLRRQPETVAEAVPAIADLAEQGTQVVQELLYFARRESSPPRTIDLVELVGQQESVLRHLLPEDVALEVDLENEPVPVVADPIGLRRVLLNLVINARDAVEESGNRITVRVEHTAGRAVLEVADDGPGIPPEAREHLFEPFFTLRRQGRGSGLGLAVVYSIVTTHGGEVDVRSAEGEGARFSIRLPLADATRLESLESHAGGPASVDRVLLVEKDGRAAARTIEVLAGAGLEVRHASSCAAVDDLGGGWTPTVVVVAEEAIAGAGLGRIKCPVLLLGEAAGVDTAQLGPRVVRLTEATPEAILGALRDLGESCFQ